MKKQLWKGPGWWRIWEWIKLYQIERLWKNSQAISMANHRIRTLKWVDGSCSGLSDWTSITPALSCQFWIKSKILSHYCHIVFLFFYFCVDDFEILNCNFYLKLTLWYQATGFSFPEFISQLSFSYLPYGQNSGFNKKNSLGKSFLQMITHKFHFLLEVIWHRILFYFVLIKDKLPCSPI